MPQYAKVFMPLGKKKEAYLPYFDYEEDKEIENCGYLLKKTTIKLEGEMFNRIVQGIEYSYNSSPSSYQEIYDTIGLKFEYRLNVNQTSSYYLVIDDVAKDFIKEAYLNIAIYEGEFQEMILGTASGMSYGDADSIYDVVDNETKEFIDMLVSKKLLKKKKIRLHEQQFYNEEAW